jgi:RNA-directed DNA polymerase
MNKLNNRWEQIDWTYVQDKIFKWQQEIYTASKNGDIRRVRYLQKVLIRSMEAKLLATRRVTQDNIGKATAGVDKIKKLTPTQRMKMARTLKFPAKASPLLRVWIPKSGTKEKRPLGIPIMKDRGLQALLKSALEPEWEARFEPNSYGFRPGRNCHDAIKAIYDCIVKKGKYVMDADISKCFDKINHEAVLRKIGMKGTINKQLNYWLKSGVLDNEVFSPIISGTPQGGVISPLLANIALHGLEVHLKKWMENKDVKWRNGESVRPHRRAGTLHIIRYADDFVILHPDKKIIVECKDEVKKFLEEIGLELSKKKTRFTHTLELKPEDIEPEFDGKIGFDFLGFTIKQYKTQHRSAKTTHGELLGFKTLIYPSTKSENNHQANLHEIILKKGKAWDQSTLIKKLNEKIRGWASYFGISNANTMKILTKHDYLLYLKLRRWGKRKHKSAAQAAKTCWKKINNRKWVFATKENILVQHIDYSNSIVQYEKVKRQSSLYDQNDVYWRKRMKNYPMLNKRVFTLLQKQKGKCKWCNLRFMDEDVMEVDHIIPKLKGGKDEYKNLQLLHRHCHDKKTATDRPVS